MRILFLSPNFPPEVNAAASRTYEHCKRWVAAGHSVTVIAPAPNWPAGKLYAGFRNSWRQQETVDGIEVVRVWTVLHPNRGYFGRLISFLSFMLHATWEAIWHRNSDVLVATSPQFFCGQAGMLTRWLIRLPFVLEIRDVWPESVVAVGAMKRSFAIRVVEWLERRMYRAADHIVTVGEGYERKLRERSGHSTSISVISNGVDLQRWNSEASVGELRTKLNSDGKFVCTYVGTVGMAHGLEVVLRAASELKRRGRDDVAFWIVGDGANREALLSQAKAEGLDNVVITGQVNKQEVAAIISTSDACLVHLRDAELFSTVVPSKIFEIMAMETPIIMGVRGPALEVVEKAQGGLAMVPEDEVSLLECINAVQSQPAEYARGKSFVSEHYNRDELARRMLEELKCVARGEPVLDPSVVDDERTATATEHVVAKAA